MEDSKKTTRRISAPSLFALIQVISTVLICYGHFMRIPGEKYSGIIMLVLSFFLIPFIAEHSLTGVNSGSVPQNLHIQAPPGGFPGWSSISRKAFPIVVLVLFSGILASITAWNIHNLSKSPRIHLDGGGIRGRVVRIGTLRYNKEIILRITPADSARKGPASSYELAAVFLPSDSAVHVGDEIAVFSRVRVITGERMQGSSFDRSKVRSGIRMIGHAGKGDFALIRSHGPSLKEKIRGAMDRTIHGIFSTPTAAIVQALYFGESTRIDKQTVFNFKRAGVLHILAASGFNVGIVAAVPFFLLSPLRVNRKIILILAIAVVCFYLYITGMPVSLLRAAIMFMVYAVQRLFDLDRNGINALFISSIIILVIFPFELFGIGFQLTYGATAGIILLFRAYKSCLPGIPVFVGNSLALTLSAQVLVFPVILLHMNEVNLTGILSNLILIPGTCAVFLMSMVACCLHPLLPWCAQIVGALTGLVCSVNIAAVGILAESGGHFNAGSKYLALLIPYLLYLFPVSPAGGFIRRRGYVPITAAFLISYLVLSFSGSEPFPVAVLSGPESGVIVRMQEHETLIYGKLGNPADTEKLLTYLNSAGANRLVLCIAAPDYPALRSFASIAKRTNVSRCIISTGFHFSSALTSLCSILDTDRIALEIADLPPVLKEDLLNPLKLVSRLDNLLPKTAMTDNPPGATKRPEASGHLGEQPGQSFRVIQLE